MLTPQDVQKASFDRVAFGGYNMQQVDAFLQPLSEDYVTLYEENIVLKSKLRVLADALREYQLKEGALDAARARAQREAEALRAKTQAQCDRMLSEAEANARQRLGDLLAQLRAEQSRVNAARRASSFVGSYASSGSGCFGAAPAWQGSSPSPACSIACSSA